MITVAYYFGSLLRWQKTEQNNHVHQFELDVTFELNVVRRHFKGLLFLYVQNRRQLNALLKDIHNPAWQDQDRADPPPCVVFPDYRGIPNPSEKTVSETGQQR